MKTAYRHCQLQNGLTLLEVLIAVVVLSIGLLGLAHLQLYGLESTDDSYRRSTATYVAYDLADRMRANRDAARSGTYDDLISDTITVPSDPGCISSFCTPAQMAAIDKREWLDHFVNVSGSTDWVASLDAGVGSVTRNGDRVQITVSWSNTEDVYDSDTATTSPTTLTKTFAVEFDL